MTADWPTLSVVVALGVLLWRQQAALGVEIAALRSEVRDIDRRLARLEGWIEGGRAGRVPQGSPQANAGGPRHSPV